MSAEFSLPVSDAVKVDVLGELFNELMSELTHSGRMTAAEARVWDAHFAAIVLDKPELVTARGMVVDEAERITWAASQE